MSFIAISQLNKYVITDLINKLISNLHWAEFSISGIKLILFGLVYLVLLKLFKSNELEFITNKYWK